MPKGSLELGDLRYITPKDKSKSPEAYSAASVVNVSPIKDVKKAAEAQSMQEKFEKDMGSVKPPAKRARIGGKKRSHKTSRRVTKRRSTKRRQTK